MKIKRALRIAIYEFSFFGLFVLYFIPMDKFLKISLGILIAVIGIATIVLYDITNK